MSIKPIPYFGLSGAFQSALMLSWVMKTGGLIGSTWRMDKCPVVVVSPLSPLAYILVLYAMTTTDVSLVAPVRESSIIGSALLAWWLFGEKDPLRRILGALIVTTGIGLIARS